MKMTKIVREIITEVASLLGSQAYVEKVVKIGILLLLLQFHIYI